MAGAGEEAGTAQPEGLEQLEGMRLLGGGSSGFLSWQAILLLASF
jgi:hypothetical protein